jgi:hypothetical protein
MRKLVSLMIVLFAITFVVESKTMSKPKVVSNMKNKNKKRQRFIDLQGLDIQGMISRPQTLYILKRSDLDFTENYDEYDYSNAIIETTYQDPF